MEVLRLWGQDLVGQVALFGWVDGTGIRTTFANILMVDNVNIQSLLFASHSRNWKSRLLTLPALDIAVWLILPMRGKERFSEGFWERHFSSRWEGSTQIALPYLLLLAVRDMLLNIEGPLCCHWEILRQPQSHQPRDLTLSIIHLLYKKNEFYIV